MPNIFPFSVCNCFSVRSLLRFIPRDVEDDQRLVLPSLSFLALPPPCCFCSSILVSFIARISLHREYKAIA